MSTTLRAPGGAAAPTGARVLTQARFEASTLLRNGEQLLVAIVLPALTLFALLYAPVPGFDGPHRLDLAMAGVLGLAVISTAFTGQAISTGFDRRYGVLRLLGTTPLGRGGLLAAKALAVLVVLVIQSVVLGGIGATLGWRPHPGHLLLAVPVLVVGAWVFVALALLLAGTLRAEAVLALANLVWVLLLGIGGIVIPPHVLPGGLERLAAWLPSGALGDATRAAMLHGTIPLAPMLVLLVWGVVASVLAARFFRWSD
ncbi:ABC transporter permease [Mobilicoccus pelagius]|uniref:Putative ABC transporter permease protein n=1 Tax=Mobilicoccus pelagius NBRC 104925 TaxID=1089455 RepID=H5UTN1_9MICO|nr:ABC transporter permease [Mobilicoccus pelagius]GAB49089.1 putative ABC transporter permease protein [Mobilicoccus pelagius NBRC 104925]